MKNEIILFENQDVKLEVNMKDEMVITKFVNTTKHGAIKGKSQTHMIDYYNLDMIISILAFW